MKTYSGENSYFNNRFYINNYWYFMYICKLNPIYILTTLLVVQHLADSSTFLLIHYYT